MKHLTKPVNTLYHAKVTLEHHNKLTNHSRDIWFKTLKKTDWRKVFQSLAQEPI